MSAQDNRRWCLALDLQDDPALIAEYCGLHERVWPEIADSIRGAGIVAVTVHSSRLAGNGAASVGATTQRFPKASAG